MAMLEKYTFMGRFKQLFSSPTLQNEEESRVARLLNIILWAVVVVIVLYIVPTYIVNRHLDGGSLTLTANELSILSVAGFCLILLRLMRYGRIKLISGLFVTFSWISFTYQAVLVGGVHDAAYTTYYLIVILAAMLVGPWFAVGFTIPLIVSGYFLAYAEVHGIIIGNIDRAYSIWFDHSMILILMTVLIFLMSSSLNNNLHQARQSEKQLALAYQELQTANEAKSQFITMMSHELRTPLNVINGFSELMILGIDGTLPEAAQKEAQLIYQNGTHLTTLIEDVLDMVQTEMKDIKLSPQIVIVEEVIEKVSAEINLYIYKKSLGFDYNITPDAEVIHADPLRLKQILYNLVQNAVKFTLKGRISIQVQRPDNETVRFSVSDTGMGISKAKLAHLFDPFQQVDLSNPKPDSTGLGLLICRELVQLHQGEIWVESEEGQGTTVHFTIPTAQLERSYHDNLSQELI